MLCINCKVEHSNEYCPDCGEKLDIPPLTFTTMSTAALRTLTSMDKGFLFNFKNLFLHPKKIVDGYIQGQRKNIFNPISFLIVCITFYLIISSLIPKRMIQEGDSTLFKVGYELGANQTKEVGSFIKDYFKYFWILSIFWLSISTKLFFKKYNFTEHLAINAMVMGQATLAGFILLLIFRWPLFLDPIVYLTICYLLYKIYQTPGNKFEFAVKAGFAVFLFFILLLCFVIFLTYFFY